MYESISFACKAFLSEWTAHRRRSSWPTPDILVPSCLFCAVKSQLAKTLNVPFQSNFIQFSTSNPHFQTYWNLPEGSGAKIHNIHKKVGNSRDSTAGSPCSMRRKFAGVEAGLTEEAQKRVHERRRTSLQETLAKLTFWGMDWWWWFGWSF